MVEKWKSKFNDDELFCSNCYLHDTFWSGGNSWGIDSCPICNNQEIVTYKNMNLHQRFIAKRLFDKWWAEKVIKRTSQGWL